jgi:hypothetical protein
MCAIVTSSPVVGVCVLAQPFSSNLQGNVSSKCKSLIESKTEHRQNAWHCQPYQGNMNMGRFMASAKTSIVLRVFYLRGWRLDAVILLQFKISNTLI